MFYFKKSVLSGALYHIALLFVTMSSFNWGFFQITGIDIAARIFNGVQIPTTALAAAICISAIIVLWNNWVD